MTKSELARKVVEQIRVNKHLEGYNSTVMQNLGDAEVYYILGMKSQDPELIAFAVANTAPGDYRFSRQTVDGITAGHVLMVLQEAAEAQIEHYGLGPDDLINDVHPER